MKLWNMGLGGKTVVLGVALSLIGGVIYIAASINPVLGFYLFCGGFPVIGLGGLIIILSDYFRPPR